MSVKNNMQIKICNDNSKLFVVELIKFIFLFQAAVDAADDDDADCNEEEDDEEER